jgi:nucleoside-diphosphate-sugar epimerase
LSPAEQEVINKLLENNVFLATPGEQVRDYLHVEDVVSVLWFIIHNDLTGIFSELIQFGAIPYRDWEPMYICGDNHKLRSLGWQPHIQLGERLEDTIKW